MVEFGLAGTFSPAAVGAGVGAENTATQPWPCQTPRPGPAVASGIPAIRVATDTSWRNRNCSRTAGRGSVGTNSLRCGRRALLRQPMPAGTHAKLDDATTPSSAERRQARQKGPSHGAVSNAVFPDRAPRRSTPPCPGLTQPLPICHSRASELRSTSGFDPRLAAEGPQCWGGIAHLARPDRTNRIRREVRENSSRAWGLRP